MMNKFDFKTLVKRMLRFNHGIQNHRMMHPTREWFLGLLIGLVIFGVSVTWSAYTYIEYKNTLVEESVEEFNDLLYRDSQVESALEYFRNKKEVYSSLVNSDYVEEVGVTEVAPDDEKDEDVMTEDSEESVENSAEEIVEVEGEVGLGVETGDESVVNSDSPLQPDEQSTQDIKLAE